MRQFKLMTSLFVLGMFLISSVKSFANNIDQLPVPADAQIVAFINTYELAQKGDITSNSYFVRMLKEKLASERDESARLMERVIDNPAITGIDFKEDIVFYSNDLEHGFSIAASIANDKAFSKFVKESMTQTHFTIQNAGNYSFVAENEAGFAWDKNKVIFTFKEKTPNIKSAVLEGFTKTVKNISTTRDFSKFYNNRSEVAFWVSMEAYMNMTKKEQEKSFRELGLDANKIPQLDYKDCYATGNISHNTNDITLDIDMYLTDKAKAQYQKYNYIKDFDKQLLTFFPEKSIIAAAAAMDFKKVLNFVKPIFEDKYTEVSSGVKKEFGLSIDEIAASLKGSIALSGYDFNLFTSEPVGGIVADFNDDKFYKALMEKMKESIPAANVKKMDGYTEFTYPKATVYVSYKNRRLYVSTDETAVKSALKGTNATSFATSEFGKEMNERGGMFLNLNVKDYPPIISTMALQSREFSKAQPIIELLRSLEITSESDYKGQVKLKIAQGNKNSLARIINAIEQIVETEMK